MAFENIDTIDKWMQFYLATEPNLPMAIVQEKAYNAVIASMALREKVRNTDPNVIKTFDVSANAIAGGQQKAIGSQEEENQGSEIPMGSKKEYYIFFKKEMLLTQNQAELNEALHDDNELKCCICGKKYPNLQGHLKRIHHVSAEDYIRVCNYPEGTVLRSKKMIENTKIRTEKAQATRILNKEKMKEAAQQAASEAAQQPAADQSQQTQPGAPQENQFMKEDQHVQVNPNMQQNPF